MNDALTAAKSLPLLAIFSLAGEVRRLNWNPGDKRRLWAIIASTLINALASAFCGATVVSLLWIFEFPEHAALVPGAWAAVKGSQFCDGLMVKFIAQRVLGPNMELPKTGSTT